MRRLPARPLLWLVVCCTLVVLLGLEASSLAATPIEAPYFSYMYDYWTNFVPAPQAYLPDQVYDGSTLGVGALQNPLDLFVAPDRRVYLADTGNNRVIFMDRDYKVLAPSPSSPTTLLPTASTNPRAYSSPIQERCI